MEFGIRGQHSEHAQSMHETGLSDVYGLQMFRYMWLALHRGIPASARGLTASLRLRELATTQKGVCIFY